MSGYPTCPETSIGEGLDIIPTLPHDRYVGRRDTDSARNERGGVMSIWAAGGDRRLVRDPRVGEPVPAKPVMPRHRYHIVFGDVLMDGSPAFVILDDRQPGRRVADHLTRDQAWAVWSVLESLETGG